MAVRTAKQKAALKKAQLASARKRRKKRPGRIIKAHGKFIHRGRTKPRKLIRAAAVGGAAVFTPHGTVLAGSAARHLYHSRKARRSARKQARKSIRKKLRRK